MNIEGIRNTVVVAAGTSYWWLPSLEQTHRVAAFLFTAISILFVLMKMYCLWTGVCGDRRRE